MFNYKKEREKKTESRGVGAKFHTWEIGQWVESEGTLSQGIKSQKEKSHTAGVWQG